MSGEQGCAPTCRPALLPLLRSRVCLSRQPAALAVTVTVTVEDTGVEASVAWGGELSLLVRREVPG